VSWKDVGGFWVAAVPPSGHQLVYNVSRPPMKRLRKMNRALIGATDARPDSYGMTPQGPADLLNARRASILAGAIQPTETS
jgi:hypothetical protein